MIGAIQGTIIEKQFPHVLVDVHGVAYEIETSMTTFFQLPETQQTVTLHTHFIVREDAQILYGFYEKHERLLFRSLIKVNGVGPKLALTILSGIEPDAFVHCIRENDTKSLVQLPGVGKKTAERLLIEMRDRLADWQPLHADKIITNTPMASPEEAVKQEAISALVNLGYKLQQASKAVAAIFYDGIARDDLIRQALKGMAHE